MSNFVIGIDGGATKTLARLENAQGLLAELRGGPSSLTNNIEDSIHEVLSLCQQLLDQHSLTANQISLACGIAGAGNSQSAEMLRAALEPLGFAHLTITTDARTSLIGASDGEPMVMVAIGTGSVAMRLTADGAIRQFGGWGLAVGDEGSGAALGKSAVRALLWELDLHGAPLSKVAQRIMKEVGQQRPEILRWLAKAGPMDYAALAPLVFEHRPLCEQAKRIVDKTAREIEQLIRAASGELVLPVALSGGLSEHLSPYFSKDLIDRMVPAKGTSLDGACQLARNPDRYC